MRMLDSKRRQRHDSKCSTTSAERGAFGPETADLDAGSQFATTTASEHTITGSFEVQNRDGVGHLVGIDQVIQVSKADEFLLPTPTEIKAILNRIPLQTLRADEGVRSLAVEVIVVDDQGFVVDIVPALLDLGNERRVISESRARQQGWRPMEGGESKATSKSLYDYSNRRIRSLGIHQISALVLGLGGPKWVKEELQVVPDDQVPDHVEAVIFDTAMILRNGLLGGLVPQCLPVHDESIA